MVKKSTCPTIACSLERFRNDLSKRYPRQLTRGSAPATHRQEVVAAKTANVRLVALPPEIGVLLMVVGTAGVLLPGPVGSPFLIAGGLALWPAGFRKAEGWLMRVAPKLYETGVHQIEQFLTDLERRYPGSLGENTRSA